MEVIFIRRKGTFLSLLLLRKVPPPQMISLHISLTRNWLRAPIIRQKLVKKKKIERKICLDYIHHREWRKCHHAWHAALWRRARVNY